jgi:hypothetical protein
MFVAEVRFRAANDGSYLLPVGQIVKGPGGGNQESVVSNQ